MNVVTRSKIINPNINPYLHVIGELEAYPATYTSVPTATPTVIPFGGDVRKDTLGILNQSTHVIEFPESVIAFDFEISVELANTASTYGNSTGRRVILLNSEVTGVIWGCGAIGMPYVNPTGTSAGGGILHGAGLMVDMSVASYPVDRTLHPKFTQDSGSTIRIGDSSGLSVLQTYIKMRLYGE